MFGAVRRPRDSSYRTPGHVFRFLSFASRAAPRALIVPFRAF
ncbi:hypothetical protein B005_2511 [Nocardiopsis alba ATCC BAA-2165]|uniref:Uncharacterized protein n=1 Tax=Nocardiopsis alba (strain ATCC BAA-2165 / BE74) TaxID=1205910 RepID=J7L002_NOCAA|nr:hypothetical protein B005_2511 [Nocardiopsis alba ATCC BAA-2165]